MLSFPDTLTRGHSRAHSRAYCFVKHSDIAVMVPGLTALEMSVCECGWNLSMEKREMPLRYVTFSISKKRKKARAETETDSESV